MLRFMWKLLKLATPLYVVVKVPVNSVRSHYLPLFDTVTDSNSVVNLGGPPYCSQLNTS